MAMVSTFQLPFDSWGIQTVARLFGRCIHSLGMLSTCYTLSPIRLVKLIHSLFIYT